MFLWSNGWQLVAGAGCFPPLLVSSGSIHHTLCPRQHTKRWEVIWEMMGLHGENFHQVNPSEYLHWSPRKISKHHRKFTSVKNTKWAPNQEIQTLQQTTRENWGHKWDAVVGRQVFCWWRVAENRGWRCRKLPSGSVIQQCVRVPATPPSPHIPVFVGKGDQLNQMIRKGREGWVLPTHICSRVHRNSLRARLGWDTARFGSGFRGSASGKHLPVNAGAVETHVWSPGLEEETAALSGVPAWSIPWAGEPGRLWSMRSQSLIWQWAATAAGLSHEQISWPSWVSASPACKCDWIMETSEMWWRLNETTRMKLLEWWAQCLTQQMESAFIVAVIIFSTCRCVSPGELGRAGGGRKQPTPPAGWRARQCSGSRACWAPHLEEWPFSGGHTDRALLLGRGWMMQAGQGWKGGRGFTPNGNRIFCLVIKKKHLIKKLLGQNYEAWTLQSQKPQNLLDWENTEAFLTLKK